MGQPNTKEIRRKTRSSPQSNVGGNTTRMDNTNVIRQAAYTDTLLQTTERDSNENDNETNAPAAHRHRNVNNNNNNNKCADDSQGFSPVNGSPNQRISRQTGASATSSPNTIPLDSNSSNNRNKQNATSGQQGNYHVDPTRMSNVHSGVAAEHSVHSATPKTYPIVFRYTDRDVQVLLEKKKNVGVMVEALN